MTSAGPGVAATRPGLPVAVGSARVPHPDLILRVTTADNRLRFDLDFADTRFVQIEGARLRTDPETFRYELLKEIEGLAAEKGKSPDFLVRQLEKIGQRLYRELVSGRIAAGVPAVCRTRGRRKPKVGLGEPDLQWADAADCVRRTVDPVGADQTV